MKLYRTRIARIEVFDPERPDEPPIYEGRPAYAHKRLTPGEYYAQYNDPDIEVMLRKPTVLIVVEGDSYTVDLDSRIPYSSDYLRS